MKDSTVDFLCFSFFLFFLFLFFFKLFFSRPKWFSFSVRTFAVYFLLFPLSLEKRLCDWKQIYIFLISVKDQHNCRRIVHKMSLFRWTVIEFTSFFLLLKRISWFLALFNLYDRIHTLKYVNSTFISTLINLKFSTFLT